MRKGNHQALFFAVLLLTPIVPARADVEICNHTPHWMSYAVVAYVSLPYETWESTGWYNANPQECVKVLEGDFTGETVYYHAIIGPNGNDWEEPRDNYPVCVQNGKKYTLRGSRQIMQKCQGPYARKLAYDAKITAPSFSINLYLNQ